MRVNLIFKIIALIFFLETSVSIAADVDFDQALGRLVQENSDVQKAQLNYDAAVDSYRTSSKAYLPSVSSQASLMRQRGLDDTIQQGQVDASLNLFKFGGDRALQNSSRELKDAAEELLNHARASAGWDSSRKLLEVLSSKESLDTGRKFLELKKSSLQITTKLYKGGSRPSQDVEKLSLDVTSEEDRVQQLELAYLRAQSNLTRAIADLSLIGGWPWLGTLKKATDKNWQQILKSASVQESAEVKVANYNVASKSSLVSERRANLLPTIDLEGRHIWTRAMSVTPWEPQWTAELVFRMPIYQRGTNYFGLHEAQRALQLAQLEKSDVEKKVFVSLEQSQKSLAFAIAALERRESLSERAKLLYNQSLAAFGRGVLSVNDLLDDQTRLIRADEDATQARASAHLAVVEFCEAVSLELKACLNRF